MFMYVHVCSCRFWLAEESSLVLKINRCKTHTKKLSRLHRWRRQNICFRIYNDDGKGSVFCYRRLVWKYFFKSAILGLYSMYVAGIYWPPNTPFLSRFSSHGIVKTRTYSNLIIIYKSDLKKLFGQVMRWINVYIRSNIEMKKGNTMETPQHKNSSAPKRIGAKMSAPKRVHQTVLVPKCLDAKPSWRQNGGAQTSAPKRHTPVSCHLFTECEKAGVLTFVFVSTVTNELISIVSMFF